MRMWWWLVGELDQLLAPGRDDLRQLGCQRRSSWVAATRLQGRAQCELDLQHVGDIVPREAAQPGSDAWQGQTLKLQLAYPARCLAHPLESS